MRLLLPLAVVAAISTTATAQVVNGDFETGDFTGWTVVPAASGSLVSITSGASHSGAFSSRWGATNGLLDAIFQDVPTTPAQSYTLDFWLYNQFDGGNEFRALWNGVVLYDDTGSSFGWTQFSFNVVGGPDATSNLRFEGFDGPSYYYLDDVAVTPVPVPGAAALFSLGALLTIRRRR